MARKLLVVALAATACVHAHELVPAPGAGVQSANPRVAEQTVQGVHLRLDSGAWRQGRVRDVLSPVLVQVDNAGDRALRVAYSEFTLTGGNGFRMQALPPFQVAAQNATTVAPDYAWSGFWLAPWQARFYHPGFPVWSGPLAFDPAFYAGAAWPSALPDQEVLRRALPEGVVDPGGKVAGFLYFADQPKGKSVEFRASLVDARTNEVFGTIDIPLVVK